MEEEALIKTDHFTRRTITDSADMVNLISTSLRHHLGNISGAQMVARMLLERPNISVENQIKLLKVLEESEQKLKSLGNAIDTAFAAFTKNQPIAIESLGKIDVIDIREPSQQNSTNQNE